MENLKVLLLPLRQLFKPWCEAARNYDFAAWLSSTLLGAHEVQFHAYPVSLKPVVPEGTGLGATSA